jgi:hypothetical protein
MGEIIITEEWRSISGQLNYQVSNIGRVRNESGHIRKPRKDEDGYIILRLSLNGKKTDYRVNRLVALEFIPNPNNKPTVDHIDRVKTNNNIGNLRWATQPENEANTSKRLNMTSKYKGVYWHKDKNKWHVSITKDRKKMHIGYFKDEDEAGLAYNKKAIEYFGEFAYLNVIENNQE